MHHHHNNVWNDVNRHFGTVNDSWDYDGRHLHDETPSNDHDHDGHHHHGDDGATLYHQHDGGSYDHHHSGKINDDHHLHGLTATLNVGPADHNHDKSAEHVHDWVDARNEVVESGHYCATCGALSDDDTTFGRDDAYYDIAPFANDPAPAS